MVFDRHVLAQNKEYSSIFASLFVVRINKTVLKST